jgi:hypothetical protein
MFCLPNLVDLIVIGVVVPGMKKAFLAVKCTMFGLMWRTFITSTVVEWTRSLRKFMVCFFCS